MDPGLGEMLDTSAEERARYYALLAGLSLEQRAEKVARLAVLPVTSPALTSDAGIRRRARSRWRSSWSRGSTAGASRPSWPLI
jgi:hypothetical protein